VSAALESVPGQAESCSPGTWFCRLCRGYRLLGSIPDDCDEESTAMAFEDPRDWAPDDHRRVVPTYESLRAVFESN
jgi:hypothetical protein